MVLDGAPWFWGTTEAERDAPHPAAHLERDGSRVMVRAVDVDADAATLFRWVCQVKLAPYSYDWVDNLGRQSPRHLVPGVEQLAVGQRMMIATVAEFEPGRSITGVSTSASARVFGHTVLTYAVTERGPDRSRLVATLAVAATNPVARLGRHLLAWGDLVMMRKQLLTFKELAEQQARETARSGRL